MRDSAKRTGEKRGSAIEAQKKKGGGEGREMEVIGEQCFILKVKVSERRRSCGTHSEYKLD